MASPSTNTILKQVFEVDSKFASQAHELHNKISSIQTQTLTQILTEVLDEYAPSDYIYQFDQVEIDLGVIFSSQLEKELPFRLEEQLRAYFRSQILGEGKLNDGNSIPVHFHQIDALRHFLKYGYLKWSAQQATSPQSLLQEALSEAPEELSAMLYKVGVQSSVRKRLITQYKDAELELVVQVVAPESGDHILHYRKQIVQQQEQHRLVESGTSGFRSAIWEVIFSFIFGGNRTNNNRKFFLKFLIQKIAQRYNYTYEQLLAAIGRGVQQISYQQEEMRFGSTVLELLQEQNINPKDTPKSANTSNDPDFVLEQLERFLQTGQLSDYSVLATPAIFASSIDILIRSPKFSNSNRLKSVLTHLYNQTFLLLQLPDRVLLKLPRYLNVPGFRPIQEFMEQVQRIANKETSSYTHIQGALQTRWLDLVYLSKTSWSGDLQKDLKTFFEPLLGSRSSPLLVELKKIEPLLDKKHRNPFSLWLNQLTVSSDAPSTFFQSILEEINQRLVVFPPAVVATWIEEQLPKWTLAEGWSEQQWQQTLNLQLKTGWHEPKWEILITELTRNRHKDTSDHSPTSLSPLIRSLLESPILKKLAVQLNRDFAGMPQRVWLVEAIRTIASFSRRYGYSAIQFVEGLKQYTLDKKELNFKSQLGNLSKAIQTSLSEANREDTFYSIQLLKWVIKHQKLPWWVPEYTWNDFTTGWKAAIESPSLSNTAVKLFQTHSTRFKFEEILDQDLFYHTLQLTYRPSSQIIAFVKDFERQYLNELEAIGMLSGNQAMANWRSELSRSSDSRLDHQTISALLVKWMNKWVNKGHSSASIQHEWFSVFSLLQKHKLQSVEKSIRLSIDIDADPKNRIKSTTLNAFIAPYLNVTQPDTKQVYLAIKHLSVHSPTTFKALLSNHLFRLAIAQELSTSQQVVLIKEVLPTSAQKYVDSSLRLLELMEHQLDQKELKSLRKIWMIRLLKSIALGTVSSWAGQEWKKLFQVTLSEITGSTLQMEKHLLRINKKIRSSSFTNEKELIGFEPHQFHSPISDQKEERPYRKLGEKTERNMVDPIFISNAGLVLLAPYISPLFERCGCLQNGDFKDDQAIEKAIHLLIYAATGKMQQGEEQMVLAKVICGLPIGTPIKKEVELSTEDRETVDSLLFAITQRWPGLQDTSKDTLRSSFLVRNGRLDEEEESFYLQIENQAYDMLLDQLPWSFSRINLSWMTKMIQVEWRN